MVVPLELDEDRDDLEVVVEDQAVDGDARLQPEAELDIRRAGSLRGIENVTNPPWNTRPAGPITFGHDRCDIRQGPGERLDQGRMASWIL